MTIKDLEKLFHRDLDGVYEKEEIASFFALIMEHYYSISRLHLALDPNLSITKDEQTLFFGALDGLKKQRPIQYILGETEFCGLVFKVNENTLIPRPETEDLVNWTVGCLNDKIKSMPITGDNDAVLNVLDIGTGSGCIAVALAKTLTPIKVYALDVSEAALKIAKQNADINQVDVSFIKADILKPELLSTEFGDLKFDVMISNPPYVRHQEKKQMKPNVLDNEPHLALFVDDNDPLVYYKSIAKFALEYLNEKGELFFEINEYLGADTLQVVKEHHFENLELRKDIFGRDRLLRGVLCD